MLEYPKLTKQGNFWVSVSKAWKVEKFGRYCTVEWFQVEIDWKVQTSGSEIIKI